MKLGLSQERLSERSGHHPTYVASIERGERNITVETLLRLAVALEVDPARLVRGLTPERPQSASRDR